MHTLRAIASFLSNESSLLWLDEARASECVASPAPVDRAMRNDITFLTDGGAGGIAAFNCATCAAIILPDSLASALDLEAAMSRGVALVVFSPNPRLDFARTVNEFFAPVRPTGIDSRAVIHAEAALGKGVYVGPGATIGRAAIGDWTVIGSGTHIYDGVRVGSRCLIASGAVIGADGFGFERDSRGAPVKFPHLGTVEIGDDVEIGANACIDRGTLGPTLIGDRTKIDNLVHVAHNAKIGEDTLIAAGGLVAGSTVVGRRVWIGPTAVVSDGLAVGDDAFVTIGAVVVRDVRPGERVSGNFAVPHEKQRAAWKELLAADDPTMTL